MRRLSHDLWYSVLIRSTYAPAARSNGRVRGVEMPAANRAHYGGSYNTRAKAVRLHAYANPATVCGMCGLTLAQHARTATGKPPTWDADHQRPGDPTSPLRPVVSSCNRSAGATLGNNRRVGLRVTRQW